MNPDTDPALAAEIGRLTARDKPAEAAHFAALVRQNVRAWNEQFAEDPKASRWMALEAYTARTEVEEHSGSVIRHERLQWARRKCQELLNADGDAYAAADPNRLRLVCYLLGGSVAQRVFANRGAPVTQAAKTPRQLKLGTR